MNAGSLDSTNCTSVCRAACILLEGTTRLPDAPVITHRTFGLTGQIAFGNLDRDLTGRKSDQATVQIRKP